MCRTISSNAMLYTTYLFGTNNAAVFGNAVVLHPVEVYDDLLIQYTTALQSSHANNKFVPIWSGPQTLICWIRPGYQTIVFLLAVVIREGCLLLRLFYDMDFWQPNMKTAVTNRLTHSRVLPLTHEI